MVRNAGPFDYRGSGTLLRLEPVEMMKDSRVNTGELRDGTF